MIDLEKEQELMSLAIGASQKSYSPYSNFQVGAAILCDSGKIFTGTNVENASYGGGICAERSAAVTAVSQGERKFLAVAIFGSFKDAKEDGLQYAFPCGICRQFLREFASKDMLVLVGTSVEDYKKFSFHDEILPHSFGPEDLKVEV
ncbi:MAG: cytidine deaminase [Bacillota bacterium]|nr:cytidine deaminase [Bacillota bacterium]